MALAPAFENPVCTVPGLYASGDLSTTGQFRFVKMTTTGVALAGAGESPIGVLQNKPSAAGQAATVWGVGSVSKVISDGSVTAGQTVASGANGKAVLAASHAIGVGICLTVGASDGDVVSVLLNPTGCPT